jgi:hypothetical protein
MSNLTVIQKIIQTLIEVKAIRYNQVNKVESVLKEFLTKGNSTGNQYNFSSDIEFLNHSVDHHLKVYFDQVMKITAMIHRSSQKSGRLLSDKEIDDSAVEITSQVLNEIGMTYRRYLDKYFGDDTGLTTYVFSRIHSELIETAILYNNEYLNTTITKELTIKKILND